MSSARPPGPLPYHRLHALGRHGPGRGLLGLVLLGALLLVSGQLTWVAVALVAASLGAEATLDPVTPAGLAAIDLVWALAIPLALLIHRWLHRLPDGLLASVVRRIRWKWLLTCMGLAAVALFATVVVSMFLPQQGGATVDDSVNSFTSTTAGFILVIALLTPLQAAGEEIAFRGYLTQACGSVFAGRAADIVAVVVPALLFAAAHGIQDPAVFVDRFAFGLVAGVLVVRTGGLEAGLAMHVLNNWVAFGLTLTFGDMDAALSPEASDWWPVVGTITQSLVFLGLTLWMARRQRIEVTTGDAAGDGSVLVPPEPRM